MHKPLMKPNLLVSPVSEGYVVYDAGFNRLHELNPSAALLFELCDGSREVSAIIEISNSVLPGDATTLVPKWIDQAYEAGLIDEKEATETAAGWTAEELAERATALRDAGLIQAAYVCQEHVVRQQPDLAEHWREYGELAHILSRRDTARAAYERYLELVNDDAEIRHLLTSLRNEAPPERVPDECIQQLYTRFASFYESNMCGELEYEGPRHIGTVIASTVGARRDLNVLDLGCGTGLAGKTVQHLARRMVGVDLSPEMIGHAKTREIYDELHIAEVTRWLEESNETFDLILACDTFIYFGDLSSVLNQAARRLTSNGVIAFSVERAESGSHRLTDNGRYVHHRSHLDDAARINGLEITSELDAFIRMEYGTPVEGIYVTMSRLGDTPGLTGLHSESTSNTLKQAKPATENRATQSSSLRVHSMNPITT